MTCIYHKTMPFISNYTHAYSLSHAFTLQIIDHIKFAFSHAFNLLKSNHEIQTYTPNDVFSLQIPFTLIKVCYFTLSIQFTFMTNSIRRILSFLSFGNVVTHLTISVSHHDRCRLVHPAKWLFKNVIRHHNKCRLVHPAKWDILTMPYTIMIDADWCIPPCGTLHNFGLPS